jgi:transposase InsO family protein
MTQIARNETMETCSFLKSGQYLIHGRDGKYCPAFQKLIDAAGVNRVPLPPRSPNLNAYAERWVKSVKSEALSKLIVFGERSLRHILATTSAIITNNVLIRELAMSFQVPQRLL